MAEVVRKQFSLDRETAELLTYYASQLSLSESAFVRLMVRQIHTCIVTLEKPEKGKSDDAGQQLDLDDV